MREMTGLTHLLASSVVLGLLFFENLTFADPKTKFKSAKTFLNHSLGILPEDLHDTTDVISVDHSAPPLEKQQPTTVAAPETLQDKLFHDLAVDRSYPGVPESNMTTHKIVGVVTGDQVYQFVASRGLTLVSQGDARRSGVRRFKKQLNEPPKGLDYIDIEGHWNAEPQGRADESNILGGYGKLTLNIDGSTIRVPIVDATEDRLRYYKAHLLHSGDHFRFETHHPFPIFEMTVGKNYVPTFIMKGKGLYLEYHNEPHYHEPIDAHTGGVYLLARMIADQPSGLEWVRISGFRIPYGAAIYSEPGAIHDDATLQGHWRVGYVNAEHFSTVLIRNTRDEKVGIEFHEGN